MLAGLLRIAESVPPDVAIVDVRMPPTHTVEGLEAATLIRANGIRRSACSSCPTRSRTRHAVQLLRDTPRGTGYLLKDRVSDLREFLDAVRRVGAGGSVIDPEVVAVLLGRTRPDGPLEELTPRERSVLELMAEGRSNAAIAVRLGLTGRRSKATCA